MKLSTRAANGAAVFFGAAALAIVSSPSFALETDPNQVQLLNLQGPQEVPAPSAAESLAPIAPVDAQPAEVQSAEADAQEATPTLAYASLTDAVDAQVVSTELDRELTCLAIGVYYEAKSEPLAGQLAVAHVILNRAQSGRFPRSVCGVLTQRGQFSFVRGGQVPSAPNNAQWRKAVAVAKVAQQELWDNPVPRALFFHARHVSPGWRLAKIGMVGNHVFYR